MLRKFEVTFRQRKVSVSSQLNAIIPYKQINNLTSGLPNASFRNISLSGHHIFLLSLLVR